LHDGLKYDYPTYSDARAQWLAQLFAETAKTHPKFAVVYEPYSAYSGWIAKIEQRSDAKKIMPTGQVVLCQESGDSYSNDVNVFIDNRVTMSGLMVANQACSTQPDTHDYVRNLHIAGVAGTKGGWYNWLGRFGGSKDDSTGTVSTNYQSIVDVPDRLKLIRMLPNWDNLNKVPLNKRSWDDSNKVYTSTLSYADLNIMYSVHPVNKNVYAVFLNQNRYVEMSTPIGKIYSVDGVFNQVADVTSKMRIEGSRIYLNDPNLIGRGLIITR
jgi:hypothetical protein